MHSEIIYTEKNRPNSYHNTIMVFIVNLKVSKEIQRFFRFSTKPKNRFNENKIGCQGDNNRYEF